MENLRYDILNEEHYDILTLDGILDLNNCNEFINDVNKSITFKKMLILDLRRFEHIDSKGVGIIMNLIKNLQINNMILYVINPEEKILNTFKLVGLTKYLKILDNHQVKNIIKNQQTKIH
jgi:anti-anti-sigma factor